MVMWWSTFSIPEVLILEREDYNSLHWEVVKHFLQASLFDKEFFNIANLSPSVVVCSGAQCKNKEQAAAFVWQRKHL